MLEAIHKESGQRVSAFKLYNNLEWINKQKDKFIAEYHEIGNWDEQKKKGLNECEVAFVKAHKRLKGTNKEQSVREHFRIITQGFIENFCNESEEHKLAKIYIYDNYNLLEIYNFDNKKVQELGEIEDIRIERGVGQKRADVLISFKKWHEIFGRGIAFEIQISPQDKTETTLRSYDRSAQGYSVCWLWSSDLVDFKNKVKVIPYRGALKEYVDTTTFSEELKLGEISKKAKRFVAEQREKIMDVVNINEKILEDQEKAYNKNLTFLGTFKDCNLDDLKTRSEDIKKTTLHEYNEILSVALKKEMEKLDLKGLLESMIKNKSSQIIDKDKLPCSHCGSTDTHEYADCYMCFSCKERRYKR